MKEIYTIPEVAKMFRLSRHAVYKWVKKGYLKAYRPAKNAVWKVTRKELVNYMKEHNIPLEFLKGDKIKILIVDDEVNMTRMIRRGLQDVEQFELEIAHSGFIAGTKLESFKPDVVALDIILGDMDGRDFFQHIRNHPELNGTKVIGISDRLKKDEIQPLLDQGFDDFLQKPFKMEKLIEMIIK